MIRKSLQNKLNSNGGGVPKLSGCCTSVGAVDVKCGPRKSKESGRRRMTRGWKRSRRPESRRICPDEWLRTAPADACTTWTQPGGVPTRRAGASASRHIGSRAIFTRRQYSQWPLEIVAYGGDLSTMPCSSSEPVWRWRRRDLYAPSTGRPGPNSWETDLPNPE